VSSTPQELEACLVVLGSARPELCLELGERESLGDLTLGALDHRALVDTYFDTGDGRLVSADMALRLRKQTRGGETRELLTWKGKSVHQGVSGVARTELEGPATREFLAEVFAQLRAAGIDVDIESKPLSDEPTKWLAVAGFHPVQSRSTQRVASVLEDTLGNAVCELAIDTVRYDISGNLVIHRELELEALGATTLSKVEALAASLTSDYPGELRPWPWSKTALGRALEALHQRGALFELIDEDELSATGYDAVGKSLGS
jgi:CYTH domain